MSILAEEAGRNLARIREHKPLVHSITNYVVMNFTANVLLSMGASPVMAHAEAEVEEMVSLAGALVLNIGTLSDAWIESMFKAGAKASELHTPVVLDPVGAGATSFRTRTARNIVDRTRVSLVRGNASEIISLRGEDSKTKGVDSIHTVDDALEAAGQLAREMGTALAVTGPVDLVTDGTRSFRVENGHPLLARVTGTGCAATVTCAAFMAVDPDPVRAAASALAFFGLAGERAGEQAEGPGSFQVALIDALYTITPDDLTAGAKVQEDIPGR